MRASLNNLYAKFRDELRNDPKVMQIITHESNLPIVASTQVPAPKSQAVEPEPAPRKAALQEPTRSKSKASHSSSQAPEPSTLDLGLSGKVYFNVPAALDEAKKTGKPIFLVVVYKDKEKGAYDEVKLKWKVKGLVQPEECQQSLHENFVQLVTDADQVDDLPGFKFPTNFQSASWAFFLEPDGSTFLSENIVYSPQLGFEHLQKAYNAWKKRHG